MYYLPRTCPTHHPQTQRHYAPWRHRRRSEVEETPRRREGLPPRHGSLSQGPSWGDRGPLRRSSQVLGRVRERCLGDRQRPQDRPPARVTRRLWEDNALLRWRCLEPHPHWGESAPSHREAARRLGLGERSLPAD